jgi:uncharacterized protein YidB (DUF937 family)
MNRKLLGAAAFSLALAGGGVAGAVFGTPSLSGAQDGSGDTTTQPADASPGPRDPMGHRGEVLATAAEALGMSEDDLRSALEDGQSIAQVAEAQGVDVQTVIDALVAQATERLDEIEANLPDRMTELVNNAGLGDHRPGGHGGPGGPGGPGHPGLRAGFEAAAETIGISAEDLRSALRDGSTIAEVAAANDVDVQAVIDAMVADANEHLDQAVADGRLDQERADNIKAGLVERITAVVNGERPAGGPGGEVPPAPAEEGADTAA